MVIEDGKFYFIKNEFFILFEEYGLMKNKENGNRRPCYFCFNDSDNPEIIWFVPISSKVDKYKKLYDVKKKKYKKVYNFVFGKVLGKERVFLIQNMFPTKIEYIENKYQIKTKDVEIAKTIKKEVIKLAEDVIALTKKGIKSSFYDIMEMKKRLLNI